MSKQLKPGAPLTPGMEHGCSVKVSSSTNCGKINLYAGVAGMLIGTFRSLQALNVNLYMNLCGLYCKLSGIDTINMLCLSSPRVLFSQCCKFLATRISFLFDCPFGFL
jgi:hypothetical protein